MKNKIELNNFVSTKELRFYFNRLFKIPRSITGKGFVKSLKILGNIVDLNLIKVRSGSNVLNWTIPNEWNVYDAYILNSKGKKIIDFKVNNLHLVNYSIPIKKKNVSFDELKKNLYFIKSMPNAIPYVTAYYKRIWGFCLTYNQYKKINRKDKFTIVIDTKLHKGNLIYSDKKIIGKSKKEILIYTYLCHPQMANNELSGPLVWSFLYKYLKMTTPHYYTYRFVCAPENIGAAAFLHKNKKNVKNIVGGYIVQCAGKDKIVTYKKSRISNSLADRAALNVVKHSKFKYKIVEFTPDGSDERQFCSPGFNLPIGSIMRRMYSEYKEYHTSLDNEKCISFDTILETLKIYIETIRTLEENFIPYGKIQYGTPQLSKSKIDLYPKIMNFVREPRKNYIPLMLEIFNLAEGKIDLLEICNLKGYKFLDYIDLYKKLIKSKYIKKINR